MITHARPAFRASNKIVRAAAVAAKILPEMVATHFTGGSGIDDELGAIVYAFGKKWVVFERMDSRVRLYPMFECEK